jgi:hypothetical protein
LNELVDQFWPEIADVDTIKKMYVALFQKWKIRIHNSNDLVSFFSIRLVKSFTKTKCFQRENWLHWSPRRWFLLLLNSHSKEVNRFFVNKYWLSYFIYFFPSL